MTITTVFQSGNSLAVRIPKKFQFHNGSKVEIIKRGNEVILREVPENLSAAFTLLTQLPNDFLIERNDLPPQERDFFE